MSVITHERQTQRGGHSHQWSLQTFLYLPAQPLLGPALLERDNLSLVLLNLLSVLLDGRVRLVMVSLVPALDSEQNRTRYSHTHTSQHHYIQSFRQGEGEGEGEGGGGGGRGSIITYSPESSSQALH